MFHLCTKKAIETQGMITWFCVRRLWLYLKYSKFHSGKVWQDIHGCNFALNQDAIP